MAWQLLAAALPAAAKTVGTALQKPNQGDYKPQTDYMKKYLSYLRGRQANKEVMHLSMQPQLRAVGQQGRQMQKQVGYDVQKTGLAGSGIEAQMRLSAGQRTQQALSTATEKAVAAQTAETARLGERAADLEAKIGAEEQRSEQAFKSAQRQWKTQLKSDIIGLGASVASAGIQQGVANKGAYQQAVTSGTFEGSYDDFKAASSAGTLPGAEGLGLSEAEVGRMSPSQYATALGARKQQISGLRLAERYMGRENVKTMMDQGMTVDTIISEANTVNKRVNTLLGSDTSIEDIQSFIETSAGQSLLPGASMAVDTEDSQSSIGQESPIDNKIANLPEDDSLYIDDDFQEATTVPGGITVDSPVSPAASQMLEDADTAEDTRIRDAGMVPNVDLYGNKLPGADYVTIEERMKQLRIKPKKVETTKTVKKAPVKKPKIKKPETVAPVEKPETVKDVKVSQTVIEKENKTKRDRLVEGNYPLKELKFVERFEGEGKVRMAEPMADRFTEAFDTLKTDFDIELQVQDTYRHPDAQQQSHNRYLKNIAAGKNVPKVATADSSFHTIGFAFDLAQTDEMKENITVIAKELKKQGLVQHDDEWWHFSMEEVPENV